MRLFVAVILVLTLTQAQAVEVPSSLVQRVSTFFKNIGQKLSGNADEEASVLMQKVGKDAEEGRQMSPASHETHPNMSAVAGNVARVFVNSEGICKKKMEEFRACMSNEHRPPYSAESTEKKCNKYREY